MKEGKEQCGNFPATSGHETNRPEPPKPFSTRTNEPCTNERCINCDFKETDRCLGCEWR